MTKKYISAVLFFTLVFALCACAPTSEDNPGQDVSPSPISDDEHDESDYYDDGDDIPYAPEQPPEPVTLERGEDGILIGSMVFHEPVMRVGHFRDGETEDNVINVREGPSTDTTIVGQINYRKVVEATEVVEGWYRVTVLSNNQTGMLTGFIRSDLLKEYNEEGTHNRTQIGSRVFDEPVLLVGAVNNINVRTRPGADNPRVATLGFGQIAKATEVVDGWYHITVLPGMFTGYADSELLVEYLDTRQFFAVTYKATINGRNIELVDVRTIIPNIEYYLILATPDNFAGKPLYDRDVPLLQRSTAEKLKKAQDIFQQDGYRIKLYDAYRPSAVSGIMYDIVRDTNYVARAGTSSHNRGAAVDMSLVDADGNELEMPSPMHTFNSTSHRNSRDMSEEARSNMVYMTGVMVSVGFTTLQSEWWHFSDSATSGYPALDLSFTDFSYYFVDN